MEVPVKEEDLIKQIQLNEKQLEQIVAYYFEHALNKKVRVQNAGLRINLLVQEIKK